MRRLISLFSFLFFMVACNSNQVAPTPTVVTATAVRPNPTVTYSPLATPTPLAQVEEYLQRLHALGFSGTVLIAQKGKILLAQGYGWLDASEQEPITADTIFNIGSNTKPFTAAAILKLHDQGQLQLTDPITLYLDDVPDDKTGITIDHLLTHSGGLNHSGVFSGDFEAITREEAVRRILNSELVFPPGTESSYSDLSYILLAAIVEQVSGQSYQEFVRSALLQLAGMNSTGWWGDDPALAGRPMAHGFVAGEDRGSSADFPGPYWAIMGAGGMVSTVHDLYRWHQAVQAGQILSSDSVTAYNSPHFMLDERGGEGYGWMVFETEPGRRVRVSAGGTPQLGHNNVMTWFIDDDLLLIASSNREMYQAEDVNPTLRRIMFGQAFVMPPAVAAVDEAMVTAYAGDYLLPTGETMQMVAENGRLYLSSGDPAGFDLLFDPQNDPIPMEAEVLAFLNDDNEERPTLEQWKATQTAVLGDFIGMQVVGTAAPDASGEPWTYVTFDFTNGSALTRWIVAPGGVLQAALLETELPRIMFLPQTETEFASFAPGVSLPVQTLQFAANADGTVEMAMILADGEVVTAVKNP